MGRNDFALSSKEEHRNKVEAEKLKALSARHSRYQKRQNAVFTLLDMPQTKLAYAYHTVNLSLIFGSMLLSICSTVDYFNNNEHFSLLIFNFEVFLLTWFTLEYGLRVWSCVIVSKWKGWRGRVRFMRSAYMVADAFVIATTLTTIVLQVKETNSDFAVMRVTRFLQVIRVLRMDRQRGDLRTMGNVVMKHKKELITCYFVGFLILFGGTYMVYTVEKGDKDATIDNMVDGLYWAMITVTSVGFGDFTPVTWKGRICTGIFALVGCAFFALPAGILGSGFALQVEKQKKDQRYTKLKHPAATVIQNFWRNHAIKRGSQGTWAYMFPKAKEHISRRSYYSLLPGIKPIHDSEAFDLCRSTLGRKKTLTHAEMKTRLASVQGKTQSLTVPGMTLRRLSDTMLGISPAPRSKSGSVLSDRSSSSLKRSSLGSKNSSIQRAEKRTGLHGLPFESDTYKSGESRIHGFTDSRNQESICGSRGSRLGSMRSVFGSRLSLYAVTQHSQRKRKEKKKLYSELISGGYKGVIKFLLRVKFYADIRKFKTHRYPFVNTPEIMEKNSHHHLVTVGHLKEIDRYLDDFQEELDAMKVELRLHGIRIDKKEKRSKRQRKSRRYNTL